MNGTLLLKAGGCQGTLQELRFAASQQLADCLPSAEKQKEFLLHLLMVLAPQGIPQVLSFHPLVLERSLFHALVIPGELATITGRTGGGRRSSCYVTRRGS